MTNLINKFWTDSFTYINNGQEFELFSFFLPFNFLNLHCLWKKHQCRYKISLLNCNCQQWHICQNPKPWRVVLKQTQKCFLQMSSSQHYEHQNCIDVTDQRYCWSLEIHHLHWQRYPNRKKTFYVKIICHTKCILWPEPRWGRIIFLQI